MSLRQHKSRLPIARDGFSLVELLMVMAIISMLTALTVGSVKAISGHALTSAGNQFVDLAALARQNSVSKGAYSAVVIKTLKNGAFSAYCVMELSRQDDGTFGSWKPITPWRTLPQGVVFAKDGLPNTAPGFLDASGSTPKALPSGVAFQGQPVDFSAETVVQVYQPDGTLSAGQPLRLRLVEGVVNASNSGITYTHALGGGQPANYYDIFFLRDTGQTKVERL